MDAPTIKKKRNGCTLSKKRNVCSTTRQGWYYIKQDLPYNPLSLSILLITLFSLNHLPLKQAMDYHRLPHEPNQPPPGKSPRIVLFLIFLTFSCIYLFIYIVSRMKSTSGYADDFINVMMRIRTSTARISTTTTTRISTTTSRISTTTATRISTTTTKLPLSPTVTFTSKSSPPRSGPPWPLIMSKSLVCALYPY